MGESRLELPVEFESYTVAAEGGEEHRIVFGGRAQAASSRVQTAGRQRSHGSSMVAVPLRSV